ncbi:helix-turn-helix transcriptional regulator [Alkalihalobacillus sp. R86527]|uniref:helix-turn-helix transcriptional regulator n=1 Tax=Alkalihalobacillus sp. R86527 TaxID=3093863 RepID=UPI00367102B7
MPVVNRIREVRRRHNVSQLQLAEEIQVTHRTIIAIEENQYHPSLELALRISTYFNTSVEELFNLENTTEQDEKKKNIVLTLTLAVIGLGSVLLLAFFDDALSFFSPFLFGGIGALIGLGISKYLSKTPKHPTLPERDERSATKITSYTNIFLLVAIGVFFINVFILDYMGHETLTMIFIFQYLLVGLVLYVIGSAVVGKR